MPFGISYCTWGALIPLIEKAKNSDFHRAAQVLVEVRKISSNETSFRLRASSPKLDTIGFYLTQTTQGCSTPYGISTRASRPA